MRKTLLFIFTLAVLVALFFSYEKREAKILFVGDMFFDRYIRQVSEREGGDFIFSCIDNFLKDADAVVGNLEGPITDNPSVSEGSEIGSPDNYVFTFPPSTAKLLAKNNIKIVSLDNNHTNNFGKEGIASTKEYLSKAGVNYFGNYTIYRTKYGNTNISFISYNEFGGESIEKIVKEIREEKNKGQMVFVYAHWGDEYVAPPARVKNAAKLFVQSGADLIVGSHPHIVQESEIYKGKHIYYSLGNFIFDQYWNKDVSTGLVLDVHISDGKLNIIEHKVSLNPDGRTCLVD